jgi:outer membrane protein assembly factor BamA
LYKNNLLWAGGFGHFGTDISPVDIDELNDGTDESDMLPDTTTLFEKYVENNIIPNDQVDGGNTNFVKFGLIYDTRDNQANPMHGMWTELLFVVAPSFLGNDYSYSQMIFTHRQYFTILPKKLSFAYRLSYQGKLTGEMPFYMLPYIVSSYKTVDGLGGKKSIRGILRNRIMSDGFAYGNFEFRWKFFRTVLFNQNLYLALNPFVDMGMTVDKYYVNYDEYNDNDITEMDDELHVGYGMGLRIAINENFIIAVDYGMAKDKRDGSSGLYIGLDYLF